MKPCLTRTLFISAISKLLNSLLSFKAIEKHNCKIRSEELIR